MKPWAIVALALAAAGLLAGLALGIREGSPPPVPTAPPAPAWIRCSDGDFEEAEAAEESGRIRLRAATRGTRDDTVKFLGMRSARTGRIFAGGRFGARLDWNGQANGSYLSGALILSPRATSENPLTGPDWFKVEYIGVPPGENARLLVACRSGGRERFLFTEGWPVERREGRRIGLQDIEVKPLDGGGVRVLENDRLIFETREPVLAFQSAYLYVQLSTHSNYPPRTLHFDRFRLSDGP